MKKKSIFIFLIFYYQIALGQSDIFRIDSIPNQGILLDKGWKFHVGDNPNYAKPDFDDSKWESIDPTKDIMDLPQIPRNGQIVWLRLKIKIDSSLINTVWGANINQVGASEIYKNGNLVIKFGEINSNSNKTIAYNPSSDPNKSNYIYSNFSESKENVIAIRYALQSNIFYLKIADRSNPILKIDLKSGKNLNKNKIETNGYDSSFSDFFRVGLFFILSLLHFILFINNRKQKTNLYTSLYYFFGTLFFILNIILYQNIHIVQTRMNFAIVFYLLAFGLNLTTIGIVYSLLKVKKSWMYWFIILFPILYFIYFLRQYNIAGIIIKIFPIIMNIEAIRVTIISVFKKRSTSWLLLIGTLGWTFFYILLIFISIYANPNSINTIIMDNFFL